MQAAVSPSLNTNAAVFDPPPIVPQVEIPSEDRKLSPIMSQHVATGPRQKRALVIEDSLVVRKSLARALSKLGFDVEQAVNGLEGLRFLKEITFDIVLCDFLMPV